MRCPCCGSDAPCFCSRNRPPARPRNTGYQAPVYRSTPRTHAYSCRCNRCAQFYRQRNSSGLIGFDLGCLAVLLVCAAISGIASWVAANHAAIVRNLPVIIAAPALLTLTVCVVVIVNRREGKRPPRGRLQVEAVPPAMPPAPSPPRPRPVQAPPVCVHANTTSVNENFGPLREPGRLVAWLCLDCGTQLDPGFRSAELTPDATWPPMRMRARP